MCGISGFLTLEGTNLTQSQIEARRNIFEALTLDMQRRGDQSTGILLVNTLENKYRILKKAIKAEEFFESQKYIGVWDKINDVNFAVGHTRQKTIGAICHKNAHPFVSGHITGVHNGSVYNYKEISDKVEVDSEVIFEVLAKHEKVWEAFKELNGRFAVVSYNAKTKSPTFIRSGNPLHFFIVKELNTFFWASEPECLKIAANANRLKGFFIKLPDDKYRVVDPKTFKFKEGDIVQKEIKKYTTPTYVPSYAPTTPTSPATQPKIKTAETKLKFETVNCSKCGSPDAMDSNLTCSKCNQAHTFNCEKCKKADQYVTYDYTNDMIVCWDCIDYKRHDSRNKYVEN